MTDIQMKEIALQIISRIMEDAAFIFSDVLNQKEKPDKRVWKPEGASLRFTGEVSGVFHLWVDKGFSRLVAQNMLGIDADDEKADACGKDALKEILNIIVGNFLSEVYGEAPVFNLGLPQILNSNYNSMSNIVNLIKTKK